jgi:hypothetical protein
VPHIAAQQTIIGALPCVEVPAPIYAFAIFCSCSVAEDSAAKEKTCQNGRFFVDF